MGSRRTILAVVLAVVSIVPLGAAPALADPGCTGDATVTSGVEADLVAALATASSAATDYKICLGGTYMLTATLSFAPGNSSTLTLEGIGADATGAVLDGQSAVKILDGAADTENFTVDNLTVRNGNSTTSQGGGIDGSGGHVIATDSVFTNNETISNAGAIRARSVAISNSTFTDNVASASGGAIFATALGTDNEITDSTFNGNTSGRQGGAVRIAGAREVDISGSTFSGNSALDEGGALYVNDSSGGVSLTDSTFTGNSVTTLGGGAIGITAVAGQVSVTDSTFTSNEAVAGGGAIEADLVSGAVSIGGSTFTSNDGGSNSGGAVLVSESAGVGITGSVFESNTTDDDGGAVRVFDLDTSLTVTDSVFSNNSAGDDAGAVDDGSSLTPLVVSGSSFIGNTAVDEGGAIQLDGAATITNSTFSGNSAPFGNAIESEFGNPIDITLTHVTMGSGQDIDIDESSFGTGATLTVNSSVVGGCVFAGTVTVVSNGSNVDIADTCDLGDLTGDPMLQALANNGGKTAGNTGGTMIVQTLRPGPGSPLIDAAPVTTGTDQRGVGRPVGSMSDIGAVEVDLQAITAANFSDVENMGVPLVIDLTPNVTTPNTVFSNTTVVTVSDGSVSVDGTSITYTAPTGFVGSVTIEYRAVDDYGQVSNLATITIDVQETLPGTGLDADVLAALAGLLLITGWLLIRRRRQDSASLL